MQHMVSLHADRPGSRRRGTRPVTFRHLALALLVIGILLVGIGIASMFFAVLLVAIGAALAVFAALVIALLQLTRGCRWALVRLRRWISRAEFAQALSPWITLALRQFASMLVGFLIEWLNQGNPPPTSRSRKSSHRRRKPKRGLRFSHQFT
jgi:hypothetical protein